MNALVQAAEEQLKALQAQIVQRGCKEDFQPDPALMKDGKVSTCYHNIRFWPFCMSAFALKYAHQMFCAASSNRL